MQVVLKDKSKKNNSKRVGAVGIDVCAERISWYVKEKYIGGFESKNIRVWNSARIFRRNKEFGDGDKELKEIAELKELEQDQQTIDEYI